MSEQENPTAETEQTTTAMSEEETTSQDTKPATSSVDESAEDETAQPVAQTPERTVSPTAGSSSVSLREASSRDDDLDDDDEYDTFDDDEEDEDLYVEGPAEFVVRERGGRGRRIGSDVQASDVDYKNISLLSRFLDRRGRIISRRKTRVSAKVQRRVSVAIKRARHLALLPYTAEQTRIVRKRR